MAQTITGFALAFALSLVVTSSDAAETEHEYVGAKKCRTCHKKELIGNQFAEWKTGAHARAFESLTGDEALEYAKQAGIAGLPSENEKCVKCHVTAYGVDPALLPKRGGLKAANGVQCESCHGPGRDFRKKTIMSDREVAVSKGLWDPGKDEKICTTCHNDDSPAWDPVLYTRSDGSKTGFDFEQAKAKIAHPIPEDVKGRYVELEKKQRAERRARGESVEDDEE